MKDYARDDSGASVVLATCLDDRFPPENMLDGKDATFWMTTGMYPQECAVALQSTVHVSKITTLSMNVKKLIVEKCETDKPSAFEKVFEVAPYAEPKYLVLVLGLKLFHNVSELYNARQQQELPNRGDRLQTEVHQVNVKAKYIKFIVSSGHGEFAAINRVSVIGESTATPGE